MDDTGVFSQFTLANGLGPRLDRKKAVPGRDDCVGQLFFDEYEGKRFHQIINGACVVYPTLPSIHIDFLENTDIGAWAFSSQNKYFIAVNCGTLLKLTAVFNRLLADLDVLPQIREKIRLGHPLMGSQSICCDWTVLASFGQWPLIS